MPINSNKSMMHPVYLPFSEEEVNEHFIEINKNNKYDQSDRHRHIDYYRKSISRYNEYTKNNQNRKGKSIRELKFPCQIEKDERFWTTSCLMTIYYSKNRQQEFIKLFKKEYGDQLPTKEIKSWEDCFDENLQLFFEPNLPSPEKYKKWLGENLKKRQFIPYVLDSACNKENLEGPTNVDALLLNPKNGFSVIIEAKVLSDISFSVTYDTMRNQIARSIDVMLEENTGLCNPLDKRDPKKTLFLLVTPRCFKENPQSRFYGYKFNEYKNNPERIITDLPHREPNELKDISKLLGWLTWEDLKEENENCAMWINI